MIETEKLISLVKPHPCLYNKREKDYRNAMKKELLWDKISKKLNQSRDVTKVKWKNLKDGYTKHKKNVKGTSGQKKPYINWVWAPYLQFLNGLIEPRPTSSNITKDNTNRAENINMSPSRSPSSTGANSPDPWEPSSRVPSPSPSTSLEVPPTVAPSTKSSSRKRKSDDIEKIMDYLKSIKKDQDAVDHLFTSYAETFKNLKPQTQAAVKLKLAEMFVEAELNDLEPENRHVRCCAICAIKEES